MDKLFENYKSLLIAVAVGAVVILSCFTIVPENEQAVVVRAGRPDRIINRFAPNEPYGSTGAGVVARIPFYERLVRIDRRILNVNMEPQTVLSTDQLRLNVDAYARYRIIDPVKMVQSAGTLDTVDTQLSAILSSVVRQELGRRSFASLLTAERGTTMANIRKKLDTQARKYGAQVLDVRIKRADLPEGTPLQSAFNRMRTARDQEAKTILAQGQKNAQIIRAEADAQAAKIYADAFGKDPGFYDFYRAMQSYDTTFSDGSKGSSSIILSPDNEYLKQFRGKQ
ncbi:MAG: protease modulator HflC [Tsuneonella suprasediminis]|uniref:Protein HflC n=1 Tax=Tsuneonella suprasediminis TaxID=2306996 RepID=A0A419R1E5_9SPHN|nr:protease modulator HflC [Tsuneonella suprasediminis]RJX67777.1 protease modulator HflC [Tsuneonella suprasediminis]UBS33274.1 protease modulator HflC [Altererythrobacter sp. N1]